MVWWWRTPFVCFLSGKLFICPSILNDSFAGRTVLAVDLCFSWLWLFLANPFQPAEFLLRNQLLVLGYAPVGNWLLFSCCFYDSLFIFNLWLFNYDVSWSGLLCIHLVWNSLYFLDLHVYFFHQMKEVFFHYFSDRLPLSCSFSSPSGTPMMWMLEAWYECLKLSQKLLMLSSVLGGSFFFLFWLLVFSFLMFPIIDLIRGFIHSTVVTL